MDYFLRTLTKSETEAALLAAGLVTEEIRDEVTAFIPISGVYISYIGEIPSQLDSEGEVIRPSDSNFHTNIRVLTEVTEEQIALLPLVDPTPSVPYQVFA